MKQQQITQLPSGSWHTQVRYTDKEGNQKRKSITAPTQWEVMKLADDFRNGVLEETTHITVKQAIENYIDCRRDIRAASTICGYEIIAKNRLQYIMDKEIHSLRKADINMAIAKDVSRGLGYKSIKEAVALLKSALSEQEVEILPVSKYALPQKKAEKKELPELQKVLNAVIGSNVELPCMLALWCGGMRISEVRGLQYRDIFDDKNGNHYLYINRVRVNINNKDNVRDCNKTEKSTRTVPLPDYLYEKIMQIPHEREDEFIVNERYETIKRRYKKILSENGIDMSFHDLRAQFATTMSMIGVDKTILQKLGGWSNSKVLDSVYIRTPKQLLDENMKVYGDYLFSLISKSSD